MVNGKCNCANLEEDVQGSSASKTFDPVFAVRFLLAVNSFVDVVGLCTLGAVVVVMVGFSKSLGAAVYGVCVGLICFLSSLLLFFFHPPLALLFSHMDCYNKTSPQPTNSFCAAFLVVTSCLRGCVADGLASVFTSISTNPPHTEA